MAAKERGQEVEMSETDAAAIRAREPSQLAEEAAEPEPTLRSALAGEVLGGFIIILIGDGVVAIGTLTKSGVGDLFSAGFGWALAVALAIYCAASLSGAHFNPGFFPLIVGLTVGVLVFTTAPITMTSLNPARDLGPRIMLFFLGFGKIAFPGINHGLSLLVTTIGPIVGAVAGALFFDKVLLRNFPEPERAKGPVTEPAQLAEERDSVQVRPVRG
jgi:hypothetical protein